MKEEQIKELLYKDFKKWFSNTNWADERENKEPTKEQVKRYLGYFGINQR